MPSREACASLCYEVEECRFWMWNKKTVDCLLKKSGETNPNSSTEYITGTKACGHPLGKLEIYYMVCYLLFVFQKKSICLQIVIVTTTPRYQEVIFGMRQDLKQRARMHVPRSALKPKTVSSGHGTRKHWNVGWRHPMSPEPILSLALSLALRPVAALKSQI